MKKCLKIFLSGLLLMCLYACMADVKHESYSEEPIISVAPEPTSSVPEPESEMIPETESESESESDKKVYDGPVNPLTGEPTEMDNSANRPYAIMINNHPDAQPQHGVGQADVLFEMSVEGGMTRMMALFQDVSKVNVIGSIRSSRHDYLDLVEGYDALYIHAGGSPYAYDDIYYRAIDNVDGVRGNDEIFYRDSVRMETMAYEHTLMTTGSEILRCVPTYGYRMEHMDDFSPNLSFAENPVLEEEVSAQYCEFCFSGTKSTSFTYRDGAYYAYQYGSEYVDGNSGKQLSFSNLIAVFADMVVLDDYGRVDISMHGSGCGYYFCNGKCSDIVWEKADEDSPYDFFYPSGEKVNLKTGKSYIGILPSYQWVYYE